MSRVLVTLGLLVVWVGITFLLIPAQEGNVPLDDLVAQGIGRQFVVACAVLIVAALVLRWGDLGFGPPRPGRSVLLGWLHLLFIGGFIAVAVAGGLPPATVVLFVLVNTMLVGFSEEVMFRGFLLSAFQGVMGVWPAVILTSVMFGSVHVLNGFVTGAWGAAGLQAMMAGLSGLAFAAIRVRTGSLWPGIVLHGLWDFGLFLLGRSVQQPGEAPVAAAQSLMPALLVLPFALYAIWLLRHQRWGRREVAAG
jgi:membrane protease YdiL (CAAX protease family)